MQCHFRCQNISNYHSGQSVVPFLFQGQFDDEHCKTLQQFPSFEEHMHICLTCNFWIKSVNTIARETKEFERHIFSIDINK